MTSIHALIHHSSQRYTSTFLNSRCIFPETKKVILESLQGFSLETRSSTRLICTFLQGNQAFTGSSSLSPLGLFSLHIEPTLSFVYSETLVLGLIVPLAIGRDPKIPLCNVFSNSRDLQLGEKPWSSNLSDLTGVKEILLGPPEMLWKSFWNKNSNASEDGREYTWMKPRIPPESLQSRV